MRHNETNNMTPLPQPFLYASLPDFWQNPLFTKKSFKCPWQQRKVYYIFEQSLNLNIIIHELFSLALRIPEEKRVTLKEIGI